MRKVSIITPLFNRIDFIKEAWSSIKGQTYSNWEWIVVDDGSTDGGDEYIKQTGALDVRVHIFYRTDGAKGPSRCRNIGVEKSSGEYLIFLDADDLLANFCIEKRINYIDNQGQLDFAVFKQELFKNEVGDLSEIFNKYGENQDDYLSMFLRNENPWQTMAPIWKKESFLKLGGFNEELIIMEDPELHTRALLNELNFEVIKESKPDCFYRQNSFNKEKEEYFYELSIKGRIYFIQTIFELFKKKNLNKSKYTNYLKNIRKAYINLLKGFLIARIKDFQELFFDTLIRFKKEKIITSRDYFLIYLLGKAWLSENIVVKKLRIRGILIKLIF
ncbi:MAG: glycosyltransferase [Bacteroidales bacterium]|nr:glycosyltransferase [Bacteroidales bacterium]